MSETKTTDISLDFEKPIFELEQKINELRSFSANEGIDVSEEIKSLEKKSIKIKKDVYKNLTAWQRIQIARHPQRPYFLDYMDLICDEFIEIHGDRRYSDDKALLGGFATIDGVKCVVMGHQKGRDTKENLKRNFGCAHPEGYRKALRLMQMADKFNLPIITFIDTPGAYPGIEAEERGQAEAIAVNLREMIPLKVPIICVVIGEGGSGGALGIGIGNEILILENAYYSVISPEGCAAILWKSNDRTPDAAEALRLTANDLTKLKIVDDIVPEPLGGAHKDKKTMGENLKKSIFKSLNKLKKLSGEELVNQRYDRFRDIGYYSEIINGKEVKKDFTEFANEEPKTAKETPVKAEEQTEETKTEKKADK